MSPCPDQPQQKPTEGGWQFAGFAALAPLSVLTLTISDDYYFKVQTLVTGWRRSTGRDTKHRRGGSTNL